ncbi:transposase family Tnp2 protein [Rhizoctonia solani AG-3 Rhs1AP]|uniref:Transposase family Tnp2 protein n=2 Tax=Rhizoctonia solani AG-3 TaxID=1086053 RepID=A0A074RPJ6_9AGAM|nr:transposase family Tnp2 protein [Rhizoctonia solani AG-3 Rhs1AP]KEP49001.1 transposase family Tnp2 protein [Rhizoctonia solani 123E]
MNVAREHCGFILKCIRSILRMAFGLQDNRLRLTEALVDAVPTTLPTVLQYLSLQDHLDIYVACPKCHSIFKDLGAATNLPTCPTVDLDGTLCNTELYIQRHRGNRSWYVPIRRFSHQPLESWLARFLNRPGIEDMLEAARPLLQENCTDVWGASFLSNFPGDGKPSFFEAPVGELRLAFLVYHDFFNPYGNQIAGKKRSIGVVMMACLNLPPDVRYDIENIYFAAMIPGPKEPTLETINNYLKPIVDNLEEHYKSGVYINSTSKYPKGRKVRSVAPIQSMDIIASRAFGGLGGPSHTKFCSFCEAVLSRIDVFDLSQFPTRSMEQHRLHVQEWLSAQSLKERNSVWKEHGARYSEFLRFEWWDPLTGTTVAPMHWSKNVIEKQVRENMGCSVTAPSGIPTSRQLSRPISELELEWGKLALAHLSADELGKSKLPEPLVRFLCRQRSIFEAGLNVSRLLNDLNEWRTDNHILASDGSPTSPDYSGAVALAKTHYYLSKARKSASLLRNNSTVESLQQLCLKLKIPITRKEKKLELEELLMDAFKNVLIPNVHDSEDLGDKVAVLGQEVVEQIKLDMKETQLPSFLKTPPINFATVDHGKIGAEEYKSLAMVSLPITLIRLWGYPGANPAYRDRLDHFLHLSVAIRILAYQTITAHDINLFEYHYTQYLLGLKRLYPFSSIVPVQHLGLHIPYFLRTLGPASRYSENTPEMIIGILEDISTNHKIGELEQTLHREMIMASNLRSLMRNTPLPAELDQFRDIVEKFLGDRYPASITASGWQTSHGGGAIILDTDTYASLVGWCQHNRKKLFGRSLYLCSKIQLGNLVYQPYHIASANGYIGFRQRGSSAIIRGRIETIFQEPSANAPRIAIVVRAFKLLSAEDTKLDPYLHHPIVGRPRFGFIQLYYNAVEDDEAHIIEPVDILSHLVVTYYHDSTGSISAPCVVVMDLDLVSLKITLDLRPELTFLYAQQKHGIHN